MDDDLIERNGVIDKHVRTLIQRRIIDLIGYGEVEQVAALNDYVTHLPLGEGGDTQPSFGGVFALGPIILVTIVDQHFTELLKVHAGHAELG